MPDASTGTRTITLHSTWTGIVMSYLGGVIAVLITLGILLSAGGTTVSIVLFAGALLMLVIVLLDLPIASEFSATGVTRRAALRHHHLEWDRVTRLTRLRVGVLRTRRDGRGGGLVARVGRRSYVLVDTMESEIEHIELLRVLGEWAEPLGLVDTQRPPDGRSPTWLYRQSKWKPESARRS